MLEELWYKNAVIYSLDYLHALGLDTIRLAPFQPTPNRVNDISDFTAWIHAMVPAEINRIMGFWRTVTRGSGRAR